MRPFDVQGAIGDFEIRPSLYNEKTCTFDLAAFNARRQEMDAMREEHAGIIFAGIMANEVDFVQYCFRDPLSGKSCEVWFFQTPFLLDDTVIAFSGRDIGKSFMMRRKMIQRGVFYRAGSSLFTAFDQAHVNGQMKKLIKELDDHPLLRMFKDESTGSRQASHPWFQRFENGYEINAIAAGEKSDRGVESPHVKALIIDEAQYYPKSAWGNVLPAVDDQKTNRIYGSMIMLMGVNKDGRTDTPFYESAFSKDSIFKGHTYIFASWFNPINYTLDKHIQYLKDYGGSINASAFLQMIRGMTGENARGSIPEDLYNDAVDLGRKLGIETKVIKITKQIWEQKKGDLVDIIGRRFLDYPPSECMISADFGSTAPTEIGLWFKYARGADEPYGNDYWALWGRITLSQILPNIQAAIFDQLNEIYQPLYISIDSTAATNPVTQILTDPNNMNYNQPEKDYTHRIYEAKFNGDITARYVFEKPENAGREYKKVVLDGVEVFAQKVPANEFATTEIVRWLSEHEMALPPCDSLRKDMLGMTEIWSNRQMTYKGTPQHIVSMVRAFTLLYHSLYTLKILETSAIEHVKGSYAEESAVGCFISAGYGGSYGSGQTRYNW